ncbi:MAG: hypothetical protein RLZ37_1690 [Actinomycetota bacterium]
MNRHSLAASPADIVALSYQVSVETGIPVAHVMKDFWVTEVLRGLVSAASDTGLEVYFKGGTSLSKAFGIIERFSEDVDILVITSETNRGAVDTKLRALIAGVEARTNLSGVTQPAGTSKGIRRSTRFIYPAPSGFTDAGVSPGVLLELGTRGGAFPAEIHGIRSIIASHRQELIGEFVEFDPLSVQVLGAERTLVEKLMILHTAASHETDSLMMRHARHYYDIHRLLSRQQIRDAVAGRVLALARDVVTYSTMAGRPVAERPAEGFSESPAFSPGGGIIEKLRAVFDSQVLGQLVWPTSTKPSLDECVEIVHQFRELL